MCFSCRPGAPIGEDAASGAAVDEPLLSQVFARADYGVISEVFLQTFFSMYHSGSHALSRDKILHVM